MGKVSLAADLMQPIARIGDAEVFLIHWTGGLQSAQADKDRWRILPIFHDNRPHVNGFYSKSDMGSFMRQNGLRFIAFQQIHWMKGSYNSFWLPFIPGQSNFHQGPANLWGNVASNLGRARTSPLIDAMQNPTSQDIESILDAQSESERIASSISLALRNLDTSVGQIASAYHKELINLLAAGSIDGGRSSSMRDQALYAQVHSFFLHLGAARDYLAAFIALQLGLDPQKVDSMARLVETLRGPSSSGSPLLQILESRGYIEPIGAPSTKWKMAGWLEQATDLRNEFVHRRTYGDKTAESMGHLRAVNSENGLYR